MQKEIFLPVGLIIPFIREEAPFYVKIRRDTVKDGKSKYYLVRDSKVFPYLLPGEEKSDTVALVESEIDALLLWGVAHDILSPVAAGGCSNRPDPRTHELIAGAEILLDCLDNDGPGEKAGVWWEETFPQYTRLRPTRKDPGEMFQAGENIRGWIMQGRRAAIRE